MYSQPTVVVPVVLTRARMLTSIWYHPCELWSTLACVTMNPPPLTPPRALSLTICMHVNGKRCHLSPTTWSSHKTNKVSFDYAVLYVTTHSESYQKQKLLLQSYSHHEGARPCSPVIGRGFGPIKVPGIGTDTLEEILLYFCFVIARDIVH